MTQPAANREGTAARRARAHVALAVGVFGVSAASLLLLWRHNMLLLVVMSMEALIALWLWHERYDILFFLVLAIFGTLAEIVFVRSGVWSYANPTWFGIPIWFPAAFATHGSACQRLVAGLATLWSQRAGTETPH